MLLYLVSLTLKKSPPYENHFWQIFNLLFICISMDSLEAQMIKNLPAMQEIQV